MMGLGVRQLGGRPDINDKAFGACSAMSAAAHRCCLPANKNLCLCELAYRQHGQLLVQCKLEYRGLSPTRGSILELFSTSKKRHLMNSIIYIVGLVVIVLAALSFFGLR